MPASNEVTIKTTTTRSMTSKLGFPAAVALFTLSILPTGAATVPVTNHSFESTTLNDGAFTTSITGWTYFVNGGNAAVAWNPTINEFDGAAGAGTPVGADGTNVLSITALNTGHYAGMTQILTGTKLAAGETYTMTVAIGDWKTQSPLRWTLGIGTSSMATGTYLNSVTGNGTNYGLIIGAFTDFSVQYTATGLESQFGQDIKITLRADYVGPGIATAFDNVRFDVAGIPEPTSTPFTLKIAPNAGGASRYDLTWPSQTGKFYDLLSSTDLSTSPSTWAVFDPDGPGGMDPFGDIPATPPTNSLGPFEFSSPARFFVLREKDAPPAFSVTVHNHGVGGQNTTEAINNSLPAVLATQPDHLVIYYGLNDALWPIKLVEINAYKANLTSMVNQALAAGVKTVFLVGIHPCNMTYVAQNNPSHPEILRLQDHLAEYNAAVIQVAADTGATFIDWRARFLDESPGTSIEDAVANNADSLLLCQANSGRQDGVHLTLAGNRFLGLAVAQALAPVVASADLIACMGDSVTYGVYMNGAGTATGDTYPGVLSSTLNP